MSHGRFVPGVPIFSMGRAIPWSRPGNPLRGAGATFSHSGLRKRTAASISSKCASGPSFDQQLLDFRVSLSGIESFGAGLGAIHNGVAAIEAEWVLQVVKPVAGCLVTAVDDPAVGL